LSTVSRWITRAERTLTEEVPAPPEKVRDFYTDLDNIKLVHPLMVSVRSTGRTEAADGYVQSYRVRDRIPLGPFTLRTSYRARLHVPVDGDVCSEARQFPRVRLRITMSFQSIDNGTRIVEQMTIDAPRPLAGLTTREAVKAHTAMLAGIRRRFEPN
jgi:ligand-binding SRPBCC domain-containing protein